MSCFGICYKKKPRMSISSIPTIIPSSNGIENFDCSPTHNRRRSKNEKVKNRNVTPSKLTYESKSSKPLYELKDKFRCIFCGGETCKHEDWKRNKKTVMVGLNCDRINDELFASQRPSTVLIEKYELIKRFKELNIGLIVNVQRQGEHPYCGPNRGLEEMSGFTYHPEAFTTEGIRVRLSGWKDMNVPNSIPFMLDIVKDMLNTTKDENRTVLVHCHAGYGRTGIVLACYMIFTSTKSAEEIVKDIRKVRHDCVQKASQMDYCKTFKNFIDMAREIFTRIKRDIDFFIKHQVDLSYGDDLHKFQHVPKILCVCLEHIHELKDKLNMSNLIIYQSINGSSEWNELHENEVVQIKVNLNKGIWDCISEIDDINILSELCFDWLEDCVTYVINPDKIAKLFEDDDRLSAKLKQHISDPRQFTKDHRKTLTVYFKEGFRMIEYETIACLSHFASKIFPEDDPKMKDEFHLMLEKLSIYMLGYNIDLLYENSNQIECRKGVVNVERLIDIIIFFVIVMNHDLIDESNNSFFNLNNSKVIIDDNMSQYVARRQMEEMNSSLYNSISVNYTDFPNFFMKHLNTINDKSPGMNRKKISQFTKKSFKSEKTYGKKLTPLGVPDTDRDQMLFQMYTSLQNYFGKKNQEKKSDGINYKNKNPFQTINKDNLEVMDDFYESFQNFMKNKIGDTFNAASGNTLMLNSHVLGTVGTNQNGTSNLNGTTSFLNNKFDIEVEYLSSPKNMKDKPRLNMKNDTINEEKSTYTKEENGFHNLVKIKKIIDKEASDTNLDPYRDQERIGTASFNPKSAFFDFRHSMADLPELTNLQQKEMGKQSETSLDLRKGSAFFSMSNFQNSKPNLENMVDINNLNRHTDKFSVPSVLQNEGEKYTNSYEISKNEKSHQLKNSITPLSTKKIQSSQDVPSVNKEEKNYIYSYIKPKEKRRRTIQAQLGGKPISKFQSNTQEINQLEIEESDIKIIQEENEK